MTSYNKRPITITQGAETRGVRAYKASLLFIRPESQTTTTGYCGQCKVKYSGNYTNHECI